MRMSSIIRAAKTLVFAALVSITTSCVHQWPDPAETNVVLNLVFDTELPQGPIVDMSTRSEAASEQYDMRYIIHAYRKTGSNTYEDTPYQTFILSQDDITNPDKTVTLNIMEGTYKFSVWSDYVLQDSTADLYYNADSFKYIKLYGKEDGMKHVGNTDFRDAFLGSEEVEVIRFGGDHAPVSATINLARPLSKVVFITTDLEDWKTKVMTTLYEMALQSAKPGETVEIPKEVDLTQYTVKVHYPQYMPNAFNMVTDRTTWSDFNVSFESKLIQLSETEASMGFDYVFANNNDANVVMAVSLFDKNGAQLARSYDITVPLERGKVTTVKGSFLLEESDGGVSINPDFDGEFNIVI